jgi:serine-type D-Ala-D-Ala carboxypeptidase/endopeptidase (penicillin-binding protein 4)
MQERLVEPVIRRWCVCVMVACWAAGAAAAQSELLEDVRTAIKAADLKDSRVGVSVRDADTGTLQVSIAGDEPLTPASNMKLLTTGTALHVLGPDFAFRTRLIRQNDRLVVIGDGDPAFGDPELLELMSYTDETGAVRRGMDVEAFLKIWVDAVEQAGIKTLSEVVVDDRIFDREFVHALWPADQLNKHYCAQVSGLNIHLNLLYFYPKPGKQRPEISNFRPFAGWVVPRNQGTCQTGSKDKNTAWVSRTLGTNDLCFRGNVHFEYRDPVPVTLHDAPAFFAQLLADRLKARGIEVGAARLARPDEPEAAGDVVGPIIQTPLTTVMSRCNVDSQNLYAESLLKRSGAAVTRQSGSWTNGAAVMRHVIHQRVNDPTLAAKFIGSDGSGLSRDNRVAPNLMTAWLASFHQDSALSSVFIDSLPVGGENGTIKSRFQSLHKTGAVVQCKTGFINGVSCLSGYVTTPDGRRRTFSVMCNNLTANGGVAKAKKLQEAVVQAIAEDMAAKATVLGGQ